MAESVREQRGEAARISEGVKAEPAASPRKRPRRPGLRGAQLAALSGERVSAGAANQRAVLGTLGALNASACATMRESAGVDVSGVAVEMRPELDARGKRGVAESGSRIGVNSAATAADTHLMMHEAIHVVQQGGGVPGGVAAKAPRVERGAGGSGEVESEAVRGANALSRGEPLSIAGQTSEPQYGGDDPEQLKRVKTLAHELGQLRPRAEARKDALSDDDLALVYSCEGDLQALRTEIDALVASEGDLADLDLELEVVAQDVAQIRAAVEEAEASAARIPRTGDPVRDAFIEAYESMPTTHVLASNYQGGKHVKGSTNDERAKHARPSDGEGQYFAELDGEPVTDATIESWEKDVIQRALGDDRDVTVQQHGAGTWFLFYRFSFRVGYAAPAAREIGRVRVEWSSGNVHSHPRVR